MLTKTYCRSITISLNREGEVVRYRITKKTGLTVFSSEVGDGPMNLPNKKC